MYESLTKYIDILQTKDAGTWITDNENDGSIEHPKHMPWIVYSKAVNDFEYEIYHFEETHKEMNLKDYSNILENNGLKWEMHSMSNADVSSLDGTTVMALLIGSLRADHFSEGALLSFVKNGSILKWLIRLKEIDEEEWRNRFA